MNIKKAFTRIGLKAGQALANFALRRSEGLQLLYKIRFDAAYPCKWGTLSLTSPRSGY